MREMELAAIRILEICANNRYQRFSLSGMKSDAERDGLVELIYHGWLEHGTYTAEFYISEGFINRIKELHPECIPNW